ncbi:MAG: EAL domain-containing protein [Anaerostipes sp.]|jgi:diguanylate cyclase (GGDEF)-like protein
MTKRTILVVDDQKINRIILGKLLSQEYNILYANNGQEALDVLQEHSEAISLVLLDIVMPVMDGYEVLRQMKNNAILSKIPVIVSSQNDGEDAEIKVLTLGAYDFIGKPYNAKIICQRIRNTIEFRETAAMINKVERDELTDLYNKHFFIKQVQERILENPDKQYDILCIGVEHFKLINETYGEVQGDKVLCHIADALSATYDGDSVCGRFLGDEFYAFVTREQGEKAENVLEFIQKVNEFPIDMEIKIHCGCYAIGAEDISVGVMCDRAKLVAEKNRDKYNVLISKYDDSIREKLIDEQFITSNMKAALKAHEFQVYYQPKYDLNSERIAGAEALVRWIHPKRGFMSPGEFIPLFEKNGFITKLDYYVWESVCKDIQQWMKQGKETVAVSVNVSRADMYNPKLVDMLVHLVEKYQIPYNYLHLEVTESAYTENADQIIEVVEKLRNMGFVIEMDDFGSGYSSLNMLAEMPVDILKLDMKFVQNEVKQTESRGILSFVISLAKWLNLKVIAEGVETAEQIAALRSMDCNYVQGFYFAKPMPKKDFEKLIMNSKIIKASKLHVEEPVVKKEVVPVIPSVEHDRVMLIVDDIEVNRAVLGSIFLKEYNIVEKENGKEAFDYLEKNYDKVDIVMLDLLMPVMDGFQVLKMIRANEKMKDIPVIITSQGDKESEQKALGMEADDFISKPYQTDIVAHRVHKVIENYKLQSIQMRKLDEIRKKEHMLLSCIPGGVAIYHMKKDGRIATDYVSDGFAKICGYTAEEYLEIIKEDMRKNIFSEDLPYFQEEIEKSIRNNLSLHRTHRLYTKNHKNILVRMDANISLLGDSDEDEAVLYAVYTRVPN